MFLRTLLAAASLLISATSALKTAIVFPAYIYPSYLGWWNPLYNAVSNNPTLPFHVIINVNSGPGASAPPNGDYQVGINKLKSFPNVKLLGYVHTSYGTRPLADVQNDINIWNQFSSTGFGMNGIFFDEAPTATGTAFSAMQSMVTYARGTVGGTIYLNPGTRPDISYFNIADVIAIYEDSYANYAAFSAGASPLTKSSIIMHTFNGDLVATEKPILGNYNSVFITSNSGINGAYPYNSFGANWDTFANTTNTLQP